MPQEDYALVQEISQGRYGTALLYFNKNTCQRCAVKRMDVSDANVLKSALTEFSQISSLRNPYVVAYRETWISMPYLFIVMEYCEGGDLAQVIDKQASPEIKLLPESQVRQWTVELCLGLQHIHNHNVIHRDLKPSNIFLTTDRHVKIGDFGTSRMVHPGDLATTCTGTPLYISPEIFNGVPYGNKTDVWSLGCCVYELMSLRPAIDANQLVLKRQMILQPMPADSGYSGELVQLTKLMLTQDADQRPTVDELLQTDFMKTIRGRAELQATCRTSLPDRPLPRSQSLFNVNAYQPLTTGLPTGEDVGHFDKLHTVEQPGRQVRGLAVLDGDLYVVQQFSPTIVVYDSDFKSVKKNLNVDGLKNPCDMAACSVNQCLYITEYKTKTVFKVGKNGKVLGTWSTDGQPDGVSVTPDSNVIVALRDANKLSEYDSDGTLLTQVYIGTDTGQPRHAVRLQNGQIVLCHGFGLGGLCLLSVSGKVIRRYEKPGFSYMPTHLEVGDRGQVYVADFSGGTVDLHEPAELRHVGSTLDAKSGMIKPFRMCINEAGRRLYVSMFGAKCHACVFKITDERMHSNKMIA